jgi:glutathione S-transferase
MKLYGFPPSPNTWKVRAVAAYLGIPLELEFIDLAKGAQHAPAYLAVNPTGRTPTLVDGNVTLWESNAILQYLADKANNALWPNDAAKRADIARWQFWQLAHWGAEACQPLTFQRLVKKLLNLGPPDEAAIAKGTDAFNKEAKMLDAHLAKRKYLVGDTLTIADFAVAAPLLYAPQAEMPLGPYANVRGWLERVTALPCWRETAPQMPAAAA